MTPEQEKELVDAVKSIDYSFKYLMQYVMVVSTQKLGISPALEKGQKRPPR